jgi:cobalt/nickel transport system permease protein
VYGLHISDGLIANTWGIAASVSMWIVSVCILIWSWKKAKATYTRSISAILAISSAFVFAAQMINFPVIFGTSGHLVGGTFLAVLLGPFAAMLSMSLVLIMEAVFFADGGIIAFGMNLFNMAIIGGLSFYLIKLLAKKSCSQKRFTASIFLASWISVVIAAIITSIEVSPAFTGGITVTLPSMVLLYSIIGLAEGTITTVLITSIQRFNPSVLGGLTLLKDRNSI